MSRNLALSSALSVLLMAGFALFSPSVLTSGSDGHILFGVPSKVELGKLPLLPGLPGLR
jgi:hypothetical protein